MNIKLNEWNELVEYGNSLCDKLKNKGYNVRLKSYVMYDGRKGLSIQVFDGLGNLFKEYYTGIYTYSIMRENLYDNVKRIFAEC